MALTGDGGFGQYMAELLTAVKHGMNITHVLLNNDSSARSPRSSGRASGTSGRRISTTPTSPAYAELCGARGIRVERRGEIEAALHEALAHDGPALVEVMTDAELV